MSETETKRIATASVNVSGGVIAFSSNDGFKNTASIVGPGAYILNLEHEHAVDKLVVEATRNNASPGSIQATVIDKRTIGVNVFNSSGVAADSSFFITVDRVRD